MPSSTGPKIPPAAPRGRSVTLRDVARAAEVDPAVVSKVLSGDERLAIRDETRARVLAAVARLGYRPNAMARGLRTGTSFALGMMIPDLGNPLFPEIVAGAEAGAERAGMAVLLSHAPPGRSVDDRARGLLQESRVAGLLVATGTLPEASVRRLARAGSPLVLVNQTSRESPHHVTVDDAAGAALAVQHVASLGHLRVGHLAGDEAIDTGARRLAGYRRGLAAAGLVVDEGAIEPCGFDLEAGFAGTARLLARRPDLTALFANNAPVALGAIAALRATGRDVPRDVSVVALHDFPYAARVHPALTTVHMPLHQMGEAAAARLVSLVRGEPVGAPVMLPPVGLVVRGSTAPAHRLRSPR